MTDLLGLVLDEKQRMTEDPQARFASPALQAADLFNERMAQDYPGGVLEYAANGTSGYVSWEGITVRFSNHGPKRGSWPDYGLGHSLDMRVADWGEVNKAVNQAEILFRSRMETHV